MPISQVLRCWFLVGRSQVKIRCPAFTHRLRYIYFNDTCRSLSMQLQIGFPAFTHPPDDPFTVFHGLDIVFELGMRLKLQKSTFTHAPRLRNKTAKNEPCTFALPVIRQVSGYLSQNMGAMIKKLNRSSGKKRYLVQDHTNSDCAMKIQTEGFFYSNSPTLQTA